MANYFEVIIHRYNEVSLRENMNTRIAAGSRKGSKVLIHNGYKYQKNKVSNNIIFWRCWRKDCRSFLKTRDFDMDNPNANIVVQREDVHGHDEDDDIINADNFKASLREGIELNPTAPIKRIYSAIAADEQRQGRIDFLPQFTSVKSSMCRKRSSFIPPIPASINDVDVRDSWAETWTGEPFILEQNNNIGCVIFCTNEDLLSLLNCEIVFIDGTFRTHTNKSSPYMECTLITAYILRLV